jgi:hypothetical protein
LGVIFDGFDIFGIHVEYWMLLAALIAVIAVWYSTR